MNQRLIQTLRDAHDYVELIATSVAHEDDVERALIGQLNAAIEDQCNYYPVIRLAREEIELFAGPHPRAPSLGGDDCYQIADKVAQAIMELGYWDIVKNIVDLHLQCKEAQP